METLRVSMFQRLQITARGEAVNVRGNQVQQLLCYLLLFRSKAHSREALAEELCGDAAPGQSRRNLRKTIWRLRDVIQNRCDMDPDGLLLVEQEWIQIAEGADLWLDVVEFEEAYVAVQGMPGHEMDAGQVRRLHAAIELYTGDLLAGWYQDWVIHERQRLQFAYLAMLDKLIDYCIANDETEAGISYCMRVLEVDPARERTHRMLMSLYDRSGDRNGALEQYEHCRDALRRELDVDPEPSTTEEYLRICGRPAADVGALMDRLARYRSALTVIQRQLDEDLHQLDQVLDGKSHQRIPAMTGWQLGNIFQPPQPPAAHHRAASAGR